MYVFSTNVRRCKRGREERDVYYFICLFYFTANKAINFHSRHKDTEFLSENTSKQYEYRRQTWLPQKPLSDLFFQAYASRASIIFMYFFFF